MTGSLFHALRRRLRRACGAVSKPTPDGVTFRCERPSGHGDFHQGKVGTTEGTWRR